jgi:hypothetical protein
MKQTIRVKCPYCQHQFDYDGTISQCSNPNCGSQFPQKQLRIWSRQLGELLNKTAPVPPSTVGRDDSNSPTTVGRDARVPPQTTTPSPDVPPIPPPERLFEFRGNVFTVGQEREVCRLILQRRGLDTNIVAADGSFTPLAEKICQGINVPLPVAYTENRLQKYYEFMYEVVFKGRCQPLFVDGSKYADSPVDLWRKIKEGRIGSTVLQQWEQMDILKCYLGLEAPYYKAIEGKLNVGGELYFVDVDYVIQRLGTVAKLCTIDEFVNKRYLVMSKLAHRYPPVSGFDPDATILDSAFIAEYGSLFDGSEKADTIARYFYLASVAMQLYGHAELFGIAFDIEGIAKKAASIINWAVENNDIKRFLLLRQLLHFNVFGQYIEGLDDNFARACLQMPVEAALRNVYYLTPSSGKKLLYCSGQYANASQIAVKLSTFQAIDDFIQQDGSLIKAIENVYGVSCDTDAVKKKLLWALEKIG